MIYFDNAATTLPKPAEVRRAVLNATELGNPGRGGHKAAMDAARLLFSAREAFCRHFGAEDPSNVCFFYNATTALNVVIKSLVKRGAGLIISDMEHNAVRRPAISAARAGGTLSVFHALGTEEEICRSFENALDKNARLAVFVCTSNVCRVTLPVKKLTAIAKKRGVLTVLDCAQAGGHFPLSLKDTGADGLVFPSHKGLFGIAGAGALVVSKPLRDALERAPTLMEGGSGILSFDEGMPDALPERLEWGTPALPAVASVAAGIGFLEKIGYEQIAAHENALIARAEERLSGIPGVTVVGGAGAPFAVPRARENAHGEADRLLLGPLLFTVSSADHALLAQKLYDAGICLREGFHCAPLAHETLGTGKTGGLRLGFSLFNTAPEIDLFASALRSALGG